MKIYYIYITVISIITFGCSNFSTNENKKNIIEINKDISIDSICALQENRFLISGNPSDIAFVNDSLFLLSIGKDLILYNKQGTQIKKFGQYGEGPGEYIQPDKLYITGDEVYVWCKQCLKIIIYNIEGEFIKEHRYVKQAIKDFTIWNNKYICFLMYGDVKGDRIRIYDMNNKNNILSIKEENNIDEILSIAKQSGGVSIIYDTLMWCNPSSLTINKLSLNSLSSTENISFIDSNFNLKEKESPLKEVMNKSPNIVFKYIKENARVIQVFDTNNTLSILAETGKTEYQNKKLHKQNRKLKYYNLTKENELLNTATIKYPDNCGLVKGIKNKIYFLTGEENDDSITIILKRANL